MHLLHSLTVASQLLEECIKICEGLPRIEGVGHLARANYRLSQVLGSLGKDNESTKYLEKAMTLREDLGKLDGDYVLVNGVASDFENLVPWMLW